MSQSWTKGSFLPYFSKGLPLMGHPKTTTKMSVRVCLLSSPTPLSTAIRFQFAKAHKHKHSPHKDPVKLTQKTILKLFPHKLFSRNAEVGRKVPWKIGMLICHPVTFRPLIFLQKETVSYSCSFATTHLRAFILHLYLPVASLPMKWRTLSQPPLYQRRASYV